MSSFTLPPREEERDRPRVMRNFAPSTTPRSETHSPVISWANAYRKREHVLETRWTTVGKPECHSSKGHRYVIPVGNRRPQVPTPRNVDWQSRGQRT